MRENSMTRIKLIVLGSALASGLAIILAVAPLSAIALPKSDRLSGEQTETAFLPERFGVPSRQQ
jgi:hypothetical protein